MTSNTQSKESIKRHRRHRLLSGMNVLVSVILASMLFGMVNFLAARFLRVRADVSWRGYYSLSDKTRNMLSDLRGNIRVFVLYRSTDDSYDDIKNLLDQYVFEADRIPDFSIDVEYVDPDLDVARASELRQKYEDIEKNSIVFEANGQRVSIPAEKLFEIRTTWSQKDMGGTLFLRPVNNKVAFRGEQVFSSAIQNIMRPRRPVYYLAGHGEKDLENEEESGYSELARELQRDNVELRPLLLTRSGGIPGDAGALIIAGPVRQITQPEIDMISDYLDKNGRLLLLIDAGASTGLRRLLNEWGIKLTSGVVDGVRALGGGLMVDRYGDHPITRGLKRHKIVTMFYKRPRSIDRAGDVDEATELHADKPRATILASCNENGWLEMDPNQDPPVMDEGIDKKGPIPVAVAVEKGPISGIDVEIRPTRIVVIGDSGFVSNKADGARDLFMNSLNWLIEREEMMGIAGRPPGIIRLEMTQDDVRRAFLLVVFALPVLAAVLGIAVWLCRRR